MNSRPKKTHTPGFTRTLFGSAAQIYPEPGLTRIKDKVKYWMRGLAAPELTRQWFQILSQPELSDIVRAHPRLRSKLQRPYLHRNLKPKQRLQALREHYSFLRAKCTPQHLEKIFGKDGMVLAEFPLEENGLVSLRLLYGDMFEKEGEFTVVLFTDGGQRWIFALSFTIISFNSEESCIFIGGLQSFRDDTMRETVVTITRAMHGLRPKALLLFVAQQLAKVWGIKTIRAVSNDMSVFQDFRLKKKKVLADYDEFWIESEGRLDADGLFTLPTEFVARPTEDIKPNKRSLYKKRYVMLDELRDKIAANIRQD